ncbi:hypothetical protein K435DRAFT_868022 [Dendrothele bispora CBS 962.96]|uniref:Uncharacterized protein n=1 Tax=Dendrothele bispora (strain CBS 962.96) TaxID=1314807 RepID=A0A4S8LD76_DENBC|nr:hypothetical protein K435DRAFT_868022 [Dendrothele bispora CBS 962.96]
MSQPNDDDYVVDDTLSGCTPPIVLSCVGGNIQPITPDPKQKFYIIGMGSARGIYTNWQMVRFRAGATNQSSPTCAIGRDAALSQWRNICLLGAHNHADPVEQTAFEDPFARYSQIANYEFEDEILPTPGTPRGTSANPISIPSTPVGNSRTRINLVSPVPSKGKEKARVVGTKTRSPKLNVLPTFLPQSSLDAKVAAAVMQSGRLDVSASGSGRASTEPPRHDRESTESGWILANRTVHYVVRKPGTVQVLNEWAAAMNLYTLWRSRGFNAEMMQTDSVDELKVWLGEDNFISEDNVEDDPNPFLV